MTAVAALLLWQQMTIEPAITGEATYYAPGVMQTVIRNRGMTWADGVALNRAGDLGRVVWLQWDNGAIDGPLPVVDCAMRDDYHTRERQGRVVEVSASLARRRGFYGVGPVPVTVWFQQPKGQWR